MPLLHVTELVFSMACHELVEIRSCKANHRRALIVFRWRISCQKWVVHWPLGQVQWMLAWTGLFPHSIAKDLAWLNMHLTSFDFIDQVLATSLQFQEDMNPQQLSIGHGLKQIQDILCLDTYIHRSQVSFNCCIHGSQTCAQDLILRGDSESGDQQLPGPRSFNLQTPAVARMISNRVEWIIVYIYHIIYIYNMYI